MQSSSLSQPGAYMSHNAIVLLAVWLEVQWGYTQNCVTWPGFFFFLHEQSITTALLNFFVTQVFFLSSVPVSPQKGTFGASFDSSTTQNGPITFRLLWLRGAGCYNGELWTIFLIIIAKSSTDTAKKAREDGLQKIVDHVNVFILPLSAVSVTMVSIQRDNCPFKLLNLKPVISVSSLRIAFPSETVLQWRIREIHFSFWPNQSEINFQCSVGYNIGSLKQTW